jgi:hypothetical protein
VRRPVSHEMRRTSKRTRSTGPAIMKSGPKNMPPPQPHPQSCIMANLAFISSESLGRLQRQASG